MMPAAVLVALSVAAPVPDGGVTMGAPRRAAAATAALVPGLVVPGLGHFVAGQARTGRRLLLAGGIGLGSAATGGIGLALTGASPKTVVPFTFLTTLGIGTLLVSALADLYGVVVPPGKGGRPAVETAWRGEIGLRYVYDPAFSYRTVATGRLDARWGRVRLSPVFWAALDDDNVRVELGGAWRVAGDEGSHLEAGVALVHHRYGSEAFSTTTGEAGVAGRLDLGRIGPSLRGAFGELGAGLAYGAVRYHDLTTEPTDLLLARAAVGFYLGDGHGEIAVGYDHRHDGYAAGLKLQGIGSGPAGHFTLRGLVWLSGRFGILADVQVGSAYVTGLSAVIR